jgi:hypothetical protein
MRIDGLGEQFADVDVELMIQIDRRSVPTPWEFLCGWFKKEAGSRSMIGSPSKSY